MEQGILKSKTVPPAIKSLIRHSLIYYSSKVDITIIITIIIIITFIITFIIIIKNR